MELKDFVKETLENIVKGVSEASTEDYEFKMNSAYSNIIDFDVGIILKESKGGGVKAEVLSVFSANINAKDSKEQTNRIKFKVDLYAKTEKHKPESKVA